MTPCGARSCPSTLKPGQLLDETSLAERFGLSRSPVREALIRLAGEDLVVILPNRSTIVAPIEIASFPKYVEALDIAQRMNARLAATLRTRGGSEDHRPAPARVRGDAEDPRSPRDVGGQQELPHGDRRRPGGTRT